MRVMAVAVIVAVLALGVAYIDRSAVARDERDRLIAAMRAKERSTVDVEQRTAAELEARAGRIATLEQALAAVPAPAEPLGEFCRPGCKVRWTDQ